MTSSCGFPELLLRPVSGDLSCRFFAAAAVVASTSSRILSVLFCRASDVSSLLSTLASAERRFAVDLADAANDSIIGWGKGDVC